MKILITIVVGLLVLGCGGSKEKVAPKTEAKVKADNNDAREISGRKLTAEEEKVVGAYEAGKWSAIDSRKVLRDDGIAESYVRGEKTDEEPWRIVNGEIQIDLFDGWEGGLVSIYRINPDNSITEISYLNFMGGNEGERKELQGVALEFNWRNSATVNLVIKPTKENVVGEYVFEDDCADFIHLFLLQNGTVEGALAHKGKGFYKKELGKWKIESGELRLDFVPPIYYFVSPDVKEHAKATLNNSTAFKINSDGYITPIAYIDKGGKRRDPPIGHQVIYLKLK